jgi:flavin-dependent dehydrogenase
MQFPEKRGILMGRIFAVSMNDICVVGAGHGGLVTAIWLARNGYPVHVFERLAEDQMGHDWRDDIDWHAFHYAGLDDILAQDEYYVMLNYTFISPDQKTAITTKLQPHEREWSVDRKILIRNLIKRAKEAGVTFHFKTPITEPLLENDRIIGVKANDQEIRAALVIDNAGLHTPIRPKLPSHYQIPAQLHRGEIFHVYRAYYDVKSPVDQFKVYLGYKYLPGIAWVNFAPDCADILIGKIDPFSSEEIEKMVGEMR